MKTLEDLTGYDKAAIIFDILGDSLALNMFKDIPEPEFYELRNHAKNLRNDVPTSVKKEVLEDYYFKMLSGEKYKEESTSENMFEFLEVLDDEQLYALLSPEKPRVIALALEQLDNEKRMTFLSKVDTEKQNKIVIATGELNDIPLEAIIFTAKELKKKTAFLPESVQFSRGGGRSVSDMLGKMPEDEAMQYLDQMKINNPDLLTEVKKYFLLFDDIMNMPEDLAATFWGDPDIDLEVMAKSLKEFEAETVEKIQGYLPGKKQAMFTPHEGALSKREIDEAKGAIKNILQGKIDSGDINIEDVLASPEIEEEEGAEN
ncbi:MAG: FliG C-terminal domain-containing protein [Candidatus Marinimicrobia bacterium]|jgi:flagellar motor switch protein FliG|nr:FliG C-terminal domain-containing protein [Candidatus Neomarinimicrobiota bacterium]MDP6852662.1 FliG C-terminal domain-containing protein [Candidatus Neomarinimicrobiota bacterium]MDP6935940.1 FliG C-terminal domain-containing protein [Candidatus Neomarinimicrobiota bacterium]